MTQVPITPGKTEVQLTARGRANKIPPQLLEVPGGLFPLKSAAFEVDEYRIMAGWPVPVPEADIRINCLVSAEGAVLADRDSPLGVITNADMRWVADVDYYDQVACQWTPLQGDVTPWETTPDHLPTLVTDFEYTIGDERFIEMSALNFDSDTADYLWNDLTRAMGGTFGYTVIMVMSPNSVYGNATVANNALWGPYDPAAPWDPDHLPGYAWVQFTVANQALWMRTEEQPAQQGVPIGHGLNNAAPIYLVLSVARPQTTLYAASGPSNVPFKALAAGAAPEALSTRFWLGNGPFATSATMDMALLDLSIYGNALSKTDVVNEITTLSAVYGGDT